MRIINWFPLCGAAQGDATPGNKGGIEAIKVIYF